MYIKPRQTKENIITAITNEITQKETQKKLIISLLSSVQSYKGTQINKRLCTHIENETEKIKQQIEKWNPETRKDEQTTRMIPIFNTSLEKKDWAKETHILNFYPHEYLHRENFYFETLEDLKTQVAQRIEWITECIEKLQNEITNIDTLLEKYDTLENVHKEINKIDISSFVKDFLPLL